MKLIFHHLIALVFLTLSAVVAHGQDKNHFPKKFRNGYVNGCYEKGIHRGMSSRYSETFCNCTIETLERNYTYEQFMDLDRKRRAGQDPSSDPRFQIVSKQMKTCRELARNVK